MQSFIQTDINVSRLSCPGTEAREFGTKHITWKGTHVHEADIADTSNQWCSFWALNMVKNFVRYTGRWKFFLIKKRTQKITACKRWIFCQMLHSKCCTAVGCIRRVAISDIIFISCNRVLYIVNFVCNLLSFNFRV